MADASINLFHMVAVAPMLGYIGYNVHQQQQMNPNFGIFLLLLAIVIIGYHWSLYQAKTSASKTTKLDSDDGSGGKVDLEKSTDDVSP